ncbi:hypothetical protein EF888_21485 [Silicimonas algicola]|uniref:Uncharacterized protein n=1 Tax=Silicimonas algicola TaxID=1826607 RepID=A0A316G988_9RHOB|nr:hypothetical protein [Silicimonas algicola]AZQ69494.1 hypothetical protein EF888_21485 [Silicimonas algicola]PWK56566.1 hypothetical protein C8D95_104239 [Silicimonas algicola]
MTIKTRLNAMERASGGTEPLIVFFTTIYENEDGSDGPTSTRATIVTGPARGVFMGRADDESEDQFRIRVSAVADGTIPRPSSIIA